MKKNESEKGNIGEKKMVENLVKCMGEKDGLKRNMGENFIKSMGEKRYEKKIHG